jgi:hypothetical protein
LEGDHASNIALQREHLQIEHQARMVRIGRRYADRPIQIGQSRVGCFSFRLLNTPLHLAH